MTGIHQGQPVFKLGAPLDEARAVMLLMHGRGASASSIMELAAEFDAPGFAFIAPQAAGNTWYPQSFLASLEANEPYLTSALQAVGDAVAHIEDAGIGSERMLLLGFSQGACLTLEWAARNAQRFGGLAGLSGGLIGPHGTPRDYTGSLGGTPVFLGCSDVDPHIPLQRVNETAEVMGKLGGTVDARIYPGMPHTVNRDELFAVQALINDLR